MILLDNASISSVSLRPNGSPVIILSSGTAYTFDPDLNCFTRLSEARWSNGSDVWESKQRPNKAVPTRGAVAQIETALGEFTISERDSNAITPSNRPQWWEAAYTLGHLETRQHAARALESPSEYKMALSLYARRIADEGFRAKAEELIKELCGPLYWKPGREEPWSPTVLGMQKRDLLKDVLTTFARSKTLAKLGQDWQDTLKWIASE
ncbi:HIR complex subunit [Tulasnella sp. 403]|nr:HIR complex subunit [Tulasnella sp. 403]